MTVRSLTNICVSPSHLSVVKRRQKALCRCILLVQLKKKLSFKDYKIDFKTEGEYFDIYSKSKRAFFICRFDTNM